MFVFFLLGDSLVSEFYVPTFRNILSIPKRWHIKFWHRVITQRTNTTFTTQWKLEI